FLDKHINTIREYSFAAVFGGIIMGNAITTLGFVVFCASLIKGWKLGVAKENLRFGNPLFIALLFFVWMLASFFWSENKAEFWDEILMKAPMGLTALALMGHKPGKLFSQASLGINIGVLPVLAGIFCVLRNLFKLGGDVPASELFVYEELAGAMNMQPIYFSFFLVLGIFSLVELKPRVGKGYALKWIGIGLGALFVILLSSRMEILVMFSVGGLYSLYYGYKSGKLLKVLGLSLLGMAVGAGVIFSNPTNRTRFTEMLDFKTDYSQNKYGGRGLRIEKWSNAIEAIGDNLILGAGAGDMMDELYRVYAKNEFKVGIDNHYNPHNQYLQIALTYGVIGLLLMLLLFFALIRYALRLKNYQCLLFVGITMLSMISESLWERQAGVMLGIFLLLVSCYVTMPSEKEAEV
ncbi:MAG: O-antigen ligase family protein, partial [Luteibaculum sp.]